MPKAFESEGAHAGPHCSSRSRMPRRGTDSHAGRLPSS
jgi:hypothetical protein